MKILILISIKWISENETNKNLNRKCVCVRKMAQHGVENACIYEYRVHASGQRPPDWFIDKEITFWLHNYSLGLQKWVKRNTCSSITRDWNEKYIYSDYKRENRRVHVFYSLSLLFKILSVSFSDIHFIEIKIRIFILFYSLWLRITCYPSLSK